MAERYDLLASIFHNALSAIVTADDRGVITGWNPECEKVFGWSADEALGRPLHETIIPPRHRRRHLDGFARWLETGEGPVLGQVLELEGLRKDGTEFPIELAISPVDRTSGPTTLVAFCRDISERRAGEAGMRQAAERLHELTLMQDVAERLSFTLDSNAVYAEVAKSAASMASPPGVPLRRASLLQLMGDHLQTLTEYDTSGLTLGRNTYELSDHPILLQVVETGDSFASNLKDMPVPPATSSMIAQTDLVAAAVVPIRVGENIFGVLTVSSRDDEGFTPTQMDRLEAVAQIAGLAIGNAEHFQLMRRHAERAGELEQTKSEFLKLASHELRGPLGVLRGYLSMITDGSLDEDAIHHVAPLLSAKLTQMNDLVNQMLEAARLDDSRLELERGTVDFSAIVTGAVADLRPLLTPAHTLQLDIPDDPVKLDGDASRLRTVVSNLVDNAIKYSPDGGAIHCTLEQRGGNVTLDVSDEGIGITEVDMPRLFQRFGRLVTADNSHISGTGLGLYLSRRLVRMHGGDVTVRSDPGAGSTFTLTLPTAPAAAPL